jgi:multidrug transporter EmrE-like cation transporter
MSSISWVGWNLVIAAAVNNSIAGLLLKRSRIDVPDDSLMTLLLSPWLIASIPFFAVNVVLFAKSLDKLAVSAAYPVLAGLGFGLIAVFGKLVFDERLGMNQWLGIALILAGVILVSRP